MSENKPVNSSRIIWKLSLLTSVFYLAVAGGDIDFSWARSQNAFRQDIAQVDAEAPTTEKPVSEPKNKLEKDIIEELNRVRTNPQDYAAWLETQKQYYQGMILKLPGEEPIRTNRGLRSLEEAIVFLRQQKQLPALSFSEALVSTAKQQITAITNNQTTNNQQSFVYGKVTPEAIVMQLVVDDGFPDRRHRLAIFNQSYQNTGIACSEIPVYNTICAIAYQESTTDIAQKPTEPTPSNTTNPETTPTESETENNQLPTPPELNTPIVPEAKVTPTPEVESNDQTNSTVEPEAESESEIIVNTKPSSEVNISETSNNQTESKPETSINTSEPEAEVTPTPELESNNQTNSTVEPESEISVTPEPATNPEVATTSNTNRNSQNSQILEKIEQGTLEEGDDVIPNDGSFYDSYPLDGSAGDSFTIILESQDFDTFLAIMDQEGNIIEQNDDINEEDSNSRLEITLPDNGSYSVIVNAYDQGGKGSYVLTVRR